MMLLYDGQLPKASGTHHGTFSCHNDMQAVLLGSRLAEVFAP